MAHQQRSSFSNKQKFPDLGRTSLGLSTHETHQIPHSTLHEQPPFLMNHFTTAHTTNISIRAF